MKRTHHKHPIRIAALTIAALTTLSVFLGYARNRETSVTTANGGHASVSPSSAPSSSKPDRANQIRVGEAYGKLPLSFEANRGQTDSQVRFISRGKGYSLFLTSTEAVFSLQKDKIANDNLDATHPPTTDHRSSTGTAAVMRMRFVGTNPKAEAAGLEELPGKVNYFIGNDPKKWRTNISTYAKVRYRGIYPGVDLVYHGAQRQLEYDLIVAPGADYRKIKLAFEGVDKLETNADGDLLLHIGAEQILQRKPVVYQEVNGARREISCGYALRGERQIGFRVGHYDRTRPLVIDPVLSYSTYLGGTGSDLGYGIAVDFAGNAYVMGRPSGDFPITPGAFQNSSKGVFVAKLNAAGTSLLYSTFLGGTGGEIGFGIAVDLTGNAYVTGRVSSFNFPTTPGAFQTVLSGRGEDAFVTKLNDTGSALLYSTYLGGGDIDTGVGIAVDSAGNASVSGVTSSWNFPTMNAAQSANTGSNLFKSINSAGDWGTSNTGLNGSHVLSLAIHPTVPSTIYAGTSDGGVFKSVNGGVSWSASNTGLSVLSVNALAIDPTTPSTIYAATGATRLSGGVFKSTDGGASWNVTGLTSLQINALAIDPATTSTIYAGTADGVYKSVDGGTSWNSMSTGLTNNIVRALVIDPTNPSTLYAGTSGGGIFIGGVHKSADGGNNWSLINTGIGNRNVSSLAIDPITPSTLYAGADSGVFKTTDGGGNWIEMNVGLISSGVTALTVDPLTPSTIYAGTGFGVTSGGVFKSVNGGGNWSRTSMANIWVRSLALDPAAPSTIYAGVHIGNDAFVAQLNPAGTALTYSTYIGGSGDDQGFGIAVDPTGNIHTTGGTRSANFLTANALDASLGGPRDAFVAKFDPSQVGAASLIYSTYLGGASDEGFAGGITADAAGNSYVTGNTGSLDFPTTPGAFRTTRDSVSGDAFVAKLNPAGSAIVYATYLGGNDSDIGGGIAIDTFGNAYVTGFTRSTDFPTLNPLQAANNSSAAYKSINGGNSWIPINTGLTGIQVNALALDSMTPTTLYAGTPNGVFKSVNGGGAWTATSLVTSTTALAIDPTNPAILYAGIGSRVFKSTDAGSSWIATSLTVFPTAIVTAIVIDPVNTAIVYVGAGSGVFKSADGGGTWTATSLTNFTLALAIDPITTATIYAGTIGAGVLKSIDGGVSWSAINTGLISLTVQAIVINPSNPSILYAGTGGAGVFKSTDGGGAWNQSSAGLPADIRAMAIARSAPSILYAGSATGIVFNSTNSGGNWNATSLTANLITSLAIAPNAASTIYAGSSAGADAFVAKLNASGSALIYSTYMGGTADENTQSLAFGAIAVEGSNAYVTGVTRSNNFPTTPGAIQSAHKGLEDAFVVKITENNTPAGGNVSVQPLDSTTLTTPATLTFSNVIQGGSTTLTTSGTGPPSPPNFQLGAPPTYFELRTTAVYSGGIQMCINYTGVSFPDEAGLRLFHFESGAWVDVTTSLDTGADVICGNVTSLSPFAIFQSVNTPQTTIYLRGTGPSANPPTLLLETIAPTATIAKYKDSPSINFNGGNLWKEVGVWRAVPSLTAGSLTSLGDLRVWLGLKNSDDQGANFDLRVEVSKNGALVAAGETYCVRGLTRNQNLAKEAVATFPTFTPVTFNGATDVLSLRVLTRIGSDGAGGFCGGHSNAVGLRLYFDSISRPSRFNATAP